MRRVSIYTGTSLRGPKAKEGKIGYVLEYEAVNGKKATLTKIEAIKESTENRSNLQVILNALARLVEECEVVIYTDSEYVAGNITSVEVWEDFGWRTTKEKPIANQDLWKQFMEMKRRHLISIETKQEHEYKKWLKREMNGGKADV